MYETMGFWETGNTEADEPAVFWDYAGIWRAAEKIVYSRALQTVASARTRIEREFDRDAVRRLKQSSGADITVGGAELAGHAIGAGLVGGSQREDADRARVRSRRRPAAQAVLGGRHHSRGCRARWPRNRRGAGRRVPSVLVPDRGGRRQARPARQRPRATRTSR